MNINQSSQRSNYFTGEFLGVEDFKREQRYLSGLNRFCNHELHLWGIALDSLRVGKGVDRAVIVHPGFAIDAAGREIFLPKAIALQTPRGAGTYWLIVEYGAQPAKPVVVGDKTEFKREIEVPRFEFLPHPPGCLGEQIALAKIVVDDLRQGSLTIDPSPRRYVGLRIGRLSFTLADREENEWSFVEAWSRDKRGGLLINSPALVASDDCLVSGAMGVGTTIPGAALDVLGVGDLQGTGTLERSEGVSVFGKDTLFSFELHPGDSISTVSASGELSRARVVSIQSDVQLQTDLPINASGKPYYFRQPLIAAIKSVAEGGRSPAATAMAVRDFLNVGIGTDQPAALLHVAEGDVQLDKDWAVVFNGGGEIRTSERHVLLALRGGEGSLELQSAGDIAFRPGLDPGTDTERGMFASKAGRVGIGVSNPQNPLSVNGIIAATAGFEFPDKSVQTSAAVSIPVGTVLDWWTPDGEFQNLPWNFQVCDGGSVKDKRSPLKSIPNLTNRFVKGIPPGSTVEGGVIEHDHQIIAPAHLHNIDHTYPGVSGTTGKESHAEDYQGGAGHESSSPDHTHDYTVKYNSPTPSVSASFSAPNQATTKFPSAPPYIMLIKIIRIL